MRRTNSHTQIKLSDIARDPVVKAFFLRGEGDSPCVAADPSPAPVKTGGAVLEVA